MNCCGEIFAFVFDSGKLNSSFYGEVVFENMLKGKELLNNPTKMVVSLGDIITGKNFFDIEPYIFKDEFCTINFDELNKNNHFSDYPFCWIIEDISPNIALLVDKRLKSNLKGYVGLSRINTTSTLERKQFWKNMIRDFVIYRDKITCFQNPQYEGDFVYAESAIQLGYKVDYDVDAEYCPIEEAEILQSSFVKSDIDLEIVKQTETDIDRDLMTLNFSIRQELQISGALLWKSINALSKIYFNINGKSNEHLIEYPFFTLYFASQGIERIQKAIVELVCKKNHIPEKEKNSVYDLLMSHAHDRLNNWIEEKEDIKLNTNCRKLIDILTRFYNTVRYARYSDESYLRSTTPEYDLLLELKTTNSLDSNDNIKNNFGNYLGKLANTYFTIYDKLCSEMNIFAYELEYDSAASIVYGYREKPKNLYKEFLLRQNAKKEILYWLMKKASDYSKYSIATEAALDFDATSVEHYLWELIFNSEDGQDCYDEVDYFYDELCTEDKEKWKDRLEFIDYIIGNSRY